MIIAHDFDIFPCCEPRRIISVLLRCAKCAYVNCRCSFGKTLMFCCILVICALFPWLAVEEHPWQILIGGVGGSDHHLSKDYIQ